MLRIQRRSKPRLRSCQRRYGKENVEVFGGQRKFEVSTRELSEQVLFPEESGSSIFQIAKQARDDKGRKLFLIFRQGESEAHIASMARWGAQLKGPSKASPCHVKGERDGF